MTRSGSGANYPQQYSQGLGGAGHEPANLGDILERVLDKGIVIAGDIRVNLLDIELLTIKLRLVIASLETAREVGIDWWEHDPWLSGNNRDLELRERASARAHRGSRIRRETGRGRDRPAPGGATGRVTRRGGSRR